MPSETGYWNKEEASTQHDFSYQLAKFIGSYFGKNDKVIDFGAGNGEYIRYLHDIGFTNVWALEGDTETITEISNVIKQDLSKPFSIDKAVNGICLEVGEHIPAQYSAVLLNNLVNNVDKKIIISWAIPGQDGYHHVNCQHNLWVIKEMQHRGFKVLIDDSLKARSVIEDRWSYFRNTLMVFERC